MPSFGFIAPNFHEFKNDAWFLYLGIFPIFYKIFFESILKTLFYLYIFYKNQAYYFYANLITFNGNLFYEKSKWKWYNYIFIII
ncbi:MAG: hypothetical protein DCC88_11280 [Spirobacillus cienkowskii]|uniref:Uncharacterized protein n=1 Tax=Spirobacillus cienkowskii TaxID=495820 RepID=A0A369KU02_9BACT|nr:MAG: hypothetical protein DCC88_11280 [Spirobacillus cienkowskii]